MDAKAKERFLTEVMDPNKVSLYCSKHMYFGPDPNKATKPGEGCSRCMFVLFFHDIANTPPDKRAERLDELEEVVHKVVELAAKGKWDFIPYRHAQMELEKNN